MPHNSLTAMCKINSIQTSTVDLVDVLGELHACSRGHPAGDREHECKVATADLRVDSRILSSVEGSGTKETLSKCWSRRWVERVPCVVVGIADSGWQILVQGSNVQGGVTDGGDGVGSIEFNVQLACIGTRWDTGEPDNLVDAVCDLAICADCLRDVEVASGRECVDVVGSWIALSQLLEQGRVECLATSRCELDWCGCSRREANNAQESEDCGGSSHVDCSE